ncbi:MAG: collagen binding domain-containing protein, partial [Cumulibacter sp.]
LLAALLGIGTVLISGPAWAADRSDLIDPASVKLANALSADPDDPLLQYQHVDVSFNFSSEGLPTAADGDTFTLILPEAFQAANMTLPLIHPDSTVLGQCVVTGGNGATVECTLNANVANYEYVAGNVTVRAQVRTVTSEETVEFLVAGKVTLVDLPGDGGVGPEQPVFPQESEKWGWFTDETRAEIEWTLYLQGTDTGNADPLLVHDQLGANQTMKTDNWRIQRQVTPGANEWETIASRTAPNGAQLVVTADQTAFDLTIPRNLLDGESLYRVSYRSQTTTMNVNETYENTASFNESTISQDVTRGYTGNAAIDGPGFGSISVQKLALAGDGADAVPTDTAYTVLATYEKDGQTHSDEVTLVAGGDPTTLSGLPMGTVVTLSEIELPEIDGIEWGAPNFSTSASGVLIADGGQSAHVTVLEQTTIAIELTNTATPVATTPPTDPSEPPSAPSGPPSTDSAPPSTPAGPPAEPTLPATEEPTTPRPVAAERLLANTGMEIGPFAAISAGLIALGATALAAARRTRL